jgi:cysteate synthase
VLCFLESGKRSIILASAGNTARAFAFAATQVDIESFIIVPELSLERMWLPEGFDMSRIHLIALRNSRDYYKAIQVSAAIANRWNIPIEEGARNVARRDGMGTVMMEAAVVIGKLPDHYFQAVGSGTGGIANHESAIKLQKYDQFKDQPFPQLNLVQNAPFSPIYDAWDSGTGIDPSKNVEKQVKQIGEIYASVLANRNPPYNMKGGVRDVLKESGGKMHVVSNSEAIEAGKFFEDSEGIDITPAASVSVAALIKNIKQGFIKTEDVVLLNITGGGIKLLYSDYNPVPLKPELIIEDENDSQLDSFFMKYNHI